jgi:hypothetical protein
VPGAGVRVALARRERRVVEVRRVRVRLGLGVQRRLGRRVVGADVAVAVVLVGVAEQDAGGERD